MNYRCNAANFKVASAPASNRLLVHSGLIFDVVASLRNRTSLEIILWQLYASTAPRLAALSYTSPILEIKSASFPWIWGSLSKSTQKSRCYTITWFDAGEILFAHAAEKNSKKDARSSRCSSGRRMHLPKNCLKIEAEELKYVQITE